MAHTFPTSQPILSTIDVNESTRVFCCSKRATTKKQEKAKNRPKHNKIIKTRLQRTDDTTNPFEADSNKNKEVKLKKDDKKSKYHPHTNRRRNCW